MKGVVLIMVRKIGSLGVALLLVLSISPVWAQTAPAITSITPTTGNNLERVQIELTGTGFEGGAEVTLTREGQPDVVVHAIVDSSTMITGSLIAMGAEPGICDVVVTNPDGQSATLTAGFTLITPLAPTITSSTPNLSDDMGLVSVELTGDNFLRGAQVKLVREGQPDLDAISVMVESSTHIVCEFNLTGVTLGNWHFMVVNPDGQSGT
jgi:hypothetical protein